MAGNCLENMLWVYPIAALCDYDLVHIVQKILSRAAAREPLCLSGVFVGELVEYMM